MNSLYQAYQAYERRILHGELDTRKPVTPRTIRFSFTYRLGDLLLHLGLKLKRRALAGHAITFATMAEK